MMSSFWLPLGIAGLSLITEDGATALAAASAGSVIDPGIAFLSCALGIWIGDLGLYATGRFAGERIMTIPLVQRFAPREKLLPAQEWFRRRGPFALVFSRFLPGTRLPSYVAAGVLRTPIRLFAFITGICAAVWVGGIIFASRYLPKVTILRDQNSTRLFISAILIGLLLSFL